MIKIINEFMTGDCHMSLLLTMEHYAPWLLTVPSNRLIELLLLKKHEKYSCRYLVGILMIMNFWFFIVLIFYINFIFHVEIVLVKNIY